MEMNGKVLGLDIGISSIGVGIIDKETGEIVHSNSYLFSAANAENNKERRMFRGSRRSTRRKRHRVQRVEDLFEKYGMDIDISTIPLNVNPYEIRVRGLNNELTIEELFIALKNLVKRRGISYLDDVDDSKNISAYKKALEVNKNSLESKTPGQIQLERLENYGQLRGDFTVRDSNGQEIRIMNVFPTSAYQKEAECILRRQSEWNVCINDNFISEYIEILTGKRKYYVGPGNEKSRTDYGIFRKNGETWQNLFSILIGRCSYYPDEYRAAKASYSAQEYNLLNDLNNLIVPTETKKLSTNQKREIVEFVKSKEAVGAAEVLREVAKLVGCKKDEIKGYRVDSKGSAEVHTFEVYRVMKKYLASVEVDSLEKDTFDLLAHILTINTDKESITEAIRSDLQESFNEQQIEELVAFRKNHSNIFNKGWHNFSIKLLRELIPELYATSEEQMTILTRLGKRKREKKTRKTKFIDENLIVEEIYNPVVSKSVRQAIKIIKEATKRYGIFDEIVVEMARDKNEKDAKNRVKDIQKNNRDEKEAALLEAAREYHGKDKLPTSVYHDHKNLNLKIRLWYQQEKKCAYTGKTIKIKDLIHSKHLYEIDHILPLSLTFDDSISNKVLVLKTANQEKSQRTPYQSIDTMTSAWTYHEFKEYVKNNKKFSGKKKEYLLFEEDIIKYDVRSRFISRNLVDTRYASRVVLNALQDYYREKNAQTRVSVVRGQFTAQLRRAWGITKSRDTYHHHAVDAVIIAAASQLSLWKSKSNLLYKHSENLAVDLNTGEAWQVTEQEYKELVFSPPYKRLRETLNSNEFENSILFSYQVDTKTNRKVADATIYATRQVRLGKDREVTTYTLGKVKDIYSEEGWKGFLKQYKKDKTKFLLYHKDRKTWDCVIESIMETYYSREEEKKSHSNPFEKYKIENGPVRKYSKKGHGPIIKDLKYYSDKLGSHISITPEGSRNKVALLSIKPWRTDVYFNDQSKMYEIMGLKYSDLSFEKGTGEYKISRERYKEIKERDGVSRDAEFKFSLYRNNLILIKDSQSGEEQILRFHAKNESNMHYVELKPLNKARFEGEEPLISSLGKVAKSGQCLKGIQKPNLSLYKVITDVLGNKYIIKEEGDSPKRIG